MSLLLLFRPRRRRSVGSSLSSSGGGQRLRVYRNPRWSKKEAPTATIDVARVPTLDSVLSNPTGISEMIQFQGSEVPLLRAQEVTLEVLALLQEPYFAVSSPPVWDVPEFLAECGCILETYMTPEQVQEEEEALLLLLMAASE